MDFEKLVEAITEEVYREIVKKEVKQSISSYIDHTLLKAVATQEDIKRICEEAIKYNFFSVCVNPHWVKYSSKLLKNTPVKICAVVGFPLGATMMDVKEYECRRAIQDGASEIDMVINIGEFKNKNFQFVRREIENLKEICTNYESILKVIIETCYLSEDEILDASKICVDAGADFIKTSTGFGTGGAKVEDIILIKKVSEGRAKIKAAGGIRDYKKAMEMINAGADRIGTSSGVKIAEEEKLKYT